ncbi:lipopolysaccharide assembly protein LapA domain-containing protein [Cupriavidus taiwanensis]|uniref:LapA family protein n=1 Tax=Cupriavidus taiwanensis TaxID=164546 RepID=UPI002541452C|nr:lipopolysaccharide assembly protein LapA domain-containing protein [Cupriavidus taiwanensis]MDK3023012.1 lipopolysaccharide assembly protein LapA domain-containing protein [Cupriavidus taiwanensis]
MKLFAWIVRIVVFVLLFVLALRNTAEASLQLFFNAVWHAPLILILFAAFVLGAVAALASVAPGMMRQRMELAKLRRTAADARASATSAATAAASTAAPSTASATAVPVPRDAKSPYNVVGPKV